MKNGVGKPERQAAPVYVSLAAVEAVISDLQRNGVPQVIDESVLGEFSDSTRRQVLAGLKFLGLVGRDGRTRPAVGAIVTSYGTETWSETLADLLHRAYEPLFAQPLEDMTAEAFLNLFARTYPSTPNLTRKSVTFFLTAARSARLTLGEHLFRGRRVRGRNAVADASKRLAGGTSGRRPARNRPDARRNVSRNAPSKDRESTGIFGGGASGWNATLFLTELLDQSIMTPAEQEAVWTLLKFARRRVDVQAGH